MQLKMCLKIKNAYPLPIQERKPTAEKVSIHSLLSGGRHEPLLVSDVKLTCLADNGWVWEQLPVWKERLMLCGSAPFVPRYFYLGSQGSGRVVINANRASFVESSGGESVLAFEISSTYTEPLTIESGAGGNSQIHIFRDVKDKILRRDLNKEYVECPLSPAPLRGSFWIGDFGKDD